MLLIDGTLHNTTENNHYLISDDNYCNYDFELPNSLPDYTKTFIEIYLNKDINLDNISAEPKARVGKIFFKLLAALEEIDSRLYYQLFPSKCLGNFYEMVDLNDCEFNNSAYVELGKIDVLTDKKENLYMTPCRIIYNYFINNEDIILSYSSIINVDLNDCLKRLKEFVEIEEKKLASELEQSYFYDCKGEVVNYVETISKVFTIIEDKNLNIVGNNINSKISVAALASLLLYNDFSNYRMSEKFRDLLGNANITIDNIEKIINAKIDITTCETNNDYIWNLSFVLSNIDVKNKVEEIFSKIFNDAENSVVFTKLLNELNVDHLFIDKVIGLVTEERENQVDISYNEFYKNMLPDTITYVNSLGKIYQYLTKYDKDLMNNILFKNNDDILALTVLLTSLKYNGYIGTFFSDNGIGIDKISNEIGIDIEYDEIEKLEVNINKIYNNFYDMFFNINVSVNNNEEVERKFSRKNYELYIGILAKNNIEVRNFEKYVSNFYYEKNSKKILEISRNLFENVSLSVQEYITKSASLLDSVKFKNSSYYNYDDDIYEQLLLIVSLFFCNQNMYSNYFESIGLTTDRIFNYFNCKYEYHMTTKNCTLDMIDSRLKKYMYEGLNKDKDRSEITIENIIENVIFGDVSDNYELRNFFKSVDINLDSFVNLSEKVIEYNKKEIRKKNVMILKEITDLNIKRDILVAAKVKEYLKNKLSSSEMENINGISFFISFLLSDSKYVELFNQHGVSINTVIKKYNLDLVKIKEYITSNESYNLDEFDGNFIYAIKNILIGEYEEKYSQKYKTKIFNDGTIIRAIIRINESLFNSFLSIESARELKKIILENGTVKTTLSVEDLLKILEEKANMKPNIDVSNIDSVLNFILEGDEELSRYSEYIIMKIKELNDNSLKDESLDKIGSLVNDIYTDTEEKNFLSRFLNPKFRSIKREVNHDILGMLTEEINKHIKILIADVKKYRNVYNAITMYLKALEKYSASSHEAYDYFESKQNSVSKDTISFSESLDYSLVMEGLKDKINSYERSIVIMKNEQFHIYETMLEHIITRSALQTSKDDIIPLIGSEYLITLGKNNQKNALEFSNNLVKLFDSILCQNISETRKSLEKIEGYNLPVEIVDKLMTDLNNYMDEVEKKESIKKLLPNEETKEENKKKIKR